MPAVAVNASPSPATPVFVFVADKAVPGATLEVNAVVPAVNVPVTLKFPPTVVLPVNVVLPATDKSLPAARVTSPPPVTDIPPPVTLIAVLAAPLALLNTAVGNPGADESLFSTLNAV